MSWACELPQELLCHPVGLVILTGLDVVYNALHKIIWDAFCNNRRPNRVPLQFQVLSADNEYPKCRSKRTSYEWYIPKGILKCSWMKKHLEKIPALVVVFFDLDWDDPQWKEKQMECATKVEIVRNSLQGRNTRVAVVLIQKNAPLPPGEDVIAAERVALLCSACDLSAKSLFVLPLTDHMIGYVTRLENAFYELAHAYYHTEARRVKAHKEFLNKTTHQLLFVRHQFKIAFYNEQKQDTHTALKHYKQAYGHILDLRIHDNNLQEVKSIAGFINYKICRLSFQHKVPADAIAQFRKHIDFFKSRVGIGELAFEHSAWMSKQFQAFGDLFDEAIKLGLTAIQTQHPGFYYQQAANHSISRKQLCRNLCLPSTVTPTPNPLESLTNLEYYGQRPWRQGHQSIDPPDALKEKDGIEALQVLELQVDHSAIIIPLLINAVSQFKKYKSPRMKRSLMVKMGEEYCHAKDYSKALTLLSRVTWDYRQERWWPLLTNIFSTALRCAYLVANVQEYVTICLELIGKYTLCSREEKTRVQMNLIRIMSNDPPEPEPGCNPGCVEKAKQLWNSLEPGSQDANIFKVEMHNIVPFVECKAGFTRNTFAADAPVVLKAYLRSSCPFPMRFTKLSVLLNNQTYNQCVTAAADDGTDTGDLYLVPDKPNVHSFSFITQPEDVGKILEITSLALEMGSDTGGGRLAILHWSGAGGDALAPSVSQHMIQGSRTRMFATGELSWEQVPVQPITKIEPRASNTTVMLLHEPPCLVNEFYQVKLLMKNAEDKEITNVRLSVGVKEGRDASLHPSTHISLEKPDFEGNVVSRHEDIPLGQMSSQEETEKLVFIKCLSHGDRVLSVKLSHDIEVKVEDKVIRCHCLKKQTVPLPAQDPFDVSLSLASLQMEKIQAVHADEPFLLISDIRCTSPWPIDLHTSSLQLTPNFQIAGDSLDSQVAGVSLNTEDCSSECCCLVAPPSILPTVAMGQYLISWKRKNSDSSLPSATTTVALPSVAVEHIPLCVEVNMEAYGSVRKNFPITYSISNRTPYSQEIEISMDSSDAFMFSGHKHVHFRVLPQANHKVTYNFVPLLPGNLPLPRLHVNMLRYPGTLDEIIHKMFPSHVFVLPSGRRLTTQPGDG